MADDAQSIRSLNWRELFPFINLFRAFRVAIHPSKLLLGFALLFLLYAGGNVLDFVWPASSEAVYNEIDGFDAYRWGPEETQSFGDLRDAVKQSHARFYKDRLVQLKLVEKDDEAALDAAEKGKFQKRIRQSVIQERNDALTKAGVDLTAALKANKEAKLGETERHENEVKIRDGYEKTLREANSEALLKIDAITQIVPRPLFDTFFDYEARQLRNIVDSALSPNWLNGIAAARDLHAEPAAPDATENALRGAGVTSYSRVPAVGVLRSITNLAVTGPTWLLIYHPIYFILFAVWTLLLWAIFGGAIARIAAVHVARDEKISIRQALRFSSSKLLSFIFAPVIPLIIILVAGLLIGLGGLVLYIPWVGPIAVGLFFILALLGGFVITLVATGTVGGFNLMYPTIAVEGSDSFDAISRSFSYVFARPWRMAFYTAISIIYGALCFLFVRYFVFIVLTFTHFFVQWFLAGQARHYWPEIWPPINEQNLTYHINFEALKWSEAIGAFLIALWVYIVLAVMGAFVISFYTSANTIIYFLMRREVDATELDDVYVEETEDDFADAAAPVAAAPAAPAAVVVPAAETPAAPPASSAPPA